MAVYKNVASQKIAVFAVDSDGAAKTGDAAQITAQISLDGGATAATDDTNPTELDATDAPGIYLFDLTQAETNANLIVLVPVSSTSGVVLRPVIVYTEPTMREANVTQISGDGTAADNLESYCDGTTPQPVDVTVLGGAAQSATDLKDLVDTGYDPSTHKIAGVTAGVSLADDAITAAKFDESTAFPLGSADTGATAVARTGADSDTLETLSDQVDGVTTAAVWTPTKAGYLDAAITSRSSHSAADVWSVGTRTLSSFGSLVADIVTAVWGAVARTVTGGTVDTCTTNTDMRGTDSAALASAWTSTRAGYVDKLNVSGTLAHSDAAAAYKADTSGLATGAEITALQSHGDSEWKTATGFSTLDAEGVRTALGLASANLDTQLSGVPAGTLSALLASAGFRAALGFCAGDVSVSEDLLTWTISDIDGTPVVQLDFDADTHARTVTWL